MKRYTISTISEMGKRTLTKVMTHVRTGLLVVFFSVLFFPSSLFAAQVSIDPQFDQYLMGDTFVIPVRVNPEGKCINAIEATLQYNPAHLTAIDVGRGNSILTLWTEEPQIDKDRGIISFSGGVPGGYCGRVIGDPGFTNILAELVFTANGDIPDSGAVTNISVVRSQVFENDGRGTLLPTSNDSSNFALVRSTSSRRTNEWLTLVRGDVIAPELFDVTLSSHEKVAGGKRFIMFSTVDKQSGIDHFEVLETDKERFGLLAWISKESHWVVAKSPYVLRDQSLRSKIMVKAVDKNGNERIVTYTPPETLVHGSGMGNGMMMVLVGGIIIGSALLVYGYLRRRKESRKRRGDDSRDRRSVTDQDEISEDIYEE